MGRSEDLPLGVKFIMAFHLLSFAVWLVGQAGAVVAYDHVAEWGLQPPRAMEDPANVQVNRAIGLADTVAMLPLFLAAVTGLLRRRFYGAVASWLVFGMTVYWPVVFWCMQAFYTAGGIRHQPLSAPAVIIPGICLMIACWGSWYLARSSEVLRWK